MKKWWLVPLLLVLAACNYKAVAPNELAMILTPTGFQNDILKPGSYDIGKADNGKGNKLYLINGGGFSTKEQFVKGDVDGEDHRCTIKGFQPLTLDVRLFFAIPDVEASNGPKDLARLFTLTPAVAVDGERVYRINPEQVYIDQARQEVRAKIRQYCAAFENFDAVEAAFASTEDGGMTASVEAIVRDVLKAHDIPLTLISAAPSNFKPDQSVVAAEAKKNAADAEIDAARKIATQLGADPWEVYRLSQIAAIAAAGSAGEGQHTILMDMSVPMDARKILPVPGLVNAAPQEEDVSDETDGEEPPKE